MIKIKHPYGTTRFKETIKIKNRTYRLADTFPNYGGYDGHSRAKSYAKNLRSNGYSARVVAKINVTAVYMR